MMLSRRWFAVAVAIVTGNCTVGSGDPESPLAAGPTLPVSHLGAQVRALRVWDDPYADVQWSTTKRLLMQAHDHAANSSRALLAYDSAGYDVMPLMDYSGVASLPYARRRRLWPVDSVVSASTRTSTRTIRTWLPAAEEVGYNHVVSLFMTDYIAKWEEGQYPFREGWMYDNGQESIDQVLARGGFPILAHPWGPSHWTDGLRRYPGIEVYSAFAEQRTVRGDDPFFAEADRRGEMVEAWDRSLRDGRLVVGFAVNDHFGPDSRDSTLGPRVRDSGKSVVLTTDTTIAAVREAVVRGQVFAVRDFSVPKRTYLPIDSLSYLNGVIRVHSSGTIRWVVDGRLFREGGDTLVVEALPPTSRYVRVEVASPDGSRVYAQPMRLRPRGDVNGDWRVDQKDAALCRDVADVTRPTRIVRACASRTRNGIN